ncbi:unnamed protein product [Effrenium voratum]|nr:unnamed protein product [Effrenium voratum]CAJ1419019.1 unnamed protein product [Effrenium voratum]
MSKYVFRVCLVTLLGLGGFQHVRELELPAFTGLWLPEERCRTSLRAGPTPYTPDEYWTRRAREEGVPARAYYKLEELDRRLSLFRPGHKVLDLGCWPGSWTLYAARKIGAKGRVLGIDLKEVDFPLPKNAQTRVEDARHFRGANVPMLDVIISDMAPKTIGWSLGN